MSSTPTREYGQHALERLNRDRINHQRGKKVVVVKGGSRKR